MDVLDQLEFAVTSLHGTLSRLRSVLPPDARQGAGQRIALAALPQLMRAEAEAEKAFALVVNVAQAEIEKAQAARVQN